MVSSDAPQIYFFDGLLWYLEARNWAFEKLKTCPTGSQLFDVRMHHALYFSNLLSAVDYVSDYLKDNASARRAFIKKVEGGFGDTQNYKYVREFRNSIIHRGVDSAAIGEGAGALVYVRCPASVQDRHSTETYTCTFNYTVELAAHCNEISNAAITDTLDDIGLFDPVQHMVDYTDVYTSISETTALPDFVKPTALKALCGMDYPSFSAELAATRIKKMRSLLGQLDVGS